MRPASVRAPPLTKESAVSTSSGRPTAVTIKPAIARGKFAPAFAPKNGGNIRFPAPKT